LTKTKQKRLHITLNPTNLNRYTTLQAYVINTTPPGQKGSNHERTEFGCKDGWLNKTSKMMVAMIINLFPSKIIWTFKAYSPKLIIYTCELIKR
jgi:hypothetical protein